MPLSDDERAVIQAHSQPVDDWIKQFTANRVQLWAKFEPAVQAIEELGSSDAGPTDHPQVRATRGLTAEEAAKKARLIGHYERRAVRAANRLKPKLEPCDSPAQLLADLMLRRSINYDVYRFSTYNLPAADAEQQKRQNDEKLYFEFLSRLLKFNVLAPSIFGDFDGKDYPPCGLDRFEAWCRDAMRPVALAEPTVPEHWLPSAKILEFVDIKRSTLSEACTMKRIRAAGTGRARRIDPNSAREFAESLNAAREQFGNRSPRNNSSKK